MDTNDFVDELCGVDPNYEQEVKTLEEKLFVEIESGINNGTQLNNEEWRFGTKKNIKKRGEK